MITVEKVQAFLKQFDKDSWVVLDEESLIVASTEPEDEDRQVLGWVHICDEELEDCEECKAGPVVNE
jgi:hypothetical protein